MDAAYMRATVSAASSASTRASYFMVEGKPMTLTQIAAQLGVARQTAGIRLKREQKKNGPVTWEGLGR